MPPSRYKMYTDRMAALVPNSQLYVAFTGTFVRSQNSQTSRLFQRRNGKLSRILPPQYP